MVGGLHLGRARCARILGAQWRRREVAIGVASLLVALPVALMAVGLIKLGPRGPVFYPQGGAGSHGETFTLLKFRGMRRDAVSGGPCCAAAQTPRVKGVSASLRAARIDAFPQVLHVLRADTNPSGQQSGPLHFAPALADVIPGYDERTDVLTGITGWVQGNHPYGAFAEGAGRALRYDLYHRRHRSRRLDVRILLAMVRGSLPGIGAR